MSKLTSTPICKQCNISSIINTAMGKEFFVCTSCKKEVFFPEPVRLADQLVFNFYKERPTEGDADAN